MPTTYVRNFVSLLAVFSGLIGTPQTTHASTVQIKIAATVSFISPGPSGDYGLPGVELGDSASGIIVYDAEIADIDPRSDFGEYPMTTGLVSIQSRVNDYFFSASSFSAIVIRNIGASAADFVSFRFETQDEVIAWEFYTSGGGSDELDSADRLPVVGFEDDFEIAVGIWQIADKVLAGAPIQGSYYEAHATDISVRVVPLPSAFSGLAFGLLLLIFQVKRRVLSTQPWRVVEGGRHDYLATVIGKGDE